MPHHPISMLLHPHHPPSILHFHHLITTALPATTHTATDTHHKHLKHHIYTPTPRVIMAKRRHSKKAQQEDEEGVEATTYTDPHADQADDDDDAEERELLLASSSYTGGDDDGMDDDDDDDLLQQTKTTTTTTTTTKAKGGSSSGTKKASKGTFQSLGLSKNIFGGINRMGYKLPTPVQRKSLPEALAGKDLVCMARTGSGKTAAFLIPVLEKLKAHSHRVGTRALILSPTRELALQTIKFAKGLSRFTDLRVALLVGGDSMDEQFEALSRNPDIIIATPGRLMHHLQEVPDFSLGSVQIVVFDEADRLFEMGFAEQLQEIMRTIPEERQTLLYSATLPKMLAQFARAGLRDPVLIRLDIESKVSEQLCLAFFTCRTGNKTAALLYLLREVLPRDKLTIIFAATKHHVEFLHEVLTQVGLPCSAIYGAMDYEARKLNLERFRLGRVKYLIVTDVAARGIDVPLLDYVINYSFPPLPKLFVHRVGRAARQGRSGAAFNLVDSEETAYMVDLHLFLGRPLQNVYKSGGYEGYTLSELTPDLVHFGGFPQHLLDEENEALGLLMERNGGVISNQWRVCENAMKQYRRTRPDPSKAAIRRSKEMASAGEGGGDVHVHPLLLGSNMGRMTAGGSVEDMRAKDEMVKMLQGFRPQQTILEVQKADGGSLYKGLPVRGERRKRKQGVVLKHEVDAGIKVMRDIRKENVGLIKKKREEVAKKKQQQRALQQAKDGTGEEEEVVAPDDGVGRGEDGMEEEEEEEDTITQKVKLSKAARRQLKKQKTSSSSSSSMHVSDPAAPKGTHKSRDYKDPQHFIEYGVTEHDMMVEDRLQPRSVEKGSEALLANRLEEALLDVQPDEALEMAKRKRIMHWDARKKKFVRATMSELGEGRGKKKLRTESGVMVSAKTLPTGEIYKKWQKKTNKSLAMAGMDEEGGGGGGSDGGDSDGGGAGGGGWQQQKRERGSGGRGSRGDEEDDGRILGMRKFRHTQNKSGKVVTGRGIGGRKGLDELKTASQIHKERQKKDKERKRLAQKKSGTSKPKAPKGGGFRGKWTK